MIGLLGQISVEAVPLLLAVAKAGYTLSTFPSAPAYEPLRDALAALDAAHPGWREWT